MRISRLFPVGSSVWLAMVLALAPLRLASAIGPRDRHITSLRHGLAVEAPAGWTLSQHTGYGDTVVLLLHPDGSRISVSAAPTTAADAAALFEQNRKGLVAQKLTPAPPQPGPRGFLAVDIATPDRPDRLRQLYLVRSTSAGKQAVVLTLVGRASAFNVHLSSLDFVANRLAFDEPAPPAGAATLQSPTVPKLVLADDPPARPTGAGGAPSAAPRADAPASPQPGAAPSPSPTRPPSRSPAGPAGGSGGQLRSHDR